MIIEEDTTNEGAFNPRSRLQLNKLRQVAKIRVDHIGLSTSLEIMEDRNALITVEKQNIISLWDLDYFKKISSTKLYCYWISGIHYCPSKACLFVGTSSDLKLYHVTKQNSLVLMKTIPVYVVYAFLILEEYSLVVTSSGDGTILLWDLNHLTEGKPILSNSLNRCGNSLLFLQKFKSIAIGFNDGSISIYSLEKDREITSMRASQFKRISEWSFNEKSDTLFIKMDPDTFGCWRYDGETLFI